MFNDFSMLRALCPPLSRIWNKIRYLDEQVDRVPENTHIYILYIFSLSRTGIGRGLTWGMYFYFTVQNY